jgi:hypothetical protein
MRILLDRCANGKFAPSKIAPDKCSKKYPRRRRNRWAESNGYAKNHTQNLGSAIGIARNSDVQEGINDNRQQKRIRCQKAYASPEPRAPRVGPKAAKRGEEETRCGTHCAEDKEERKSSKSESVWHTRTRGVAQYRLKTWSSDAGLRQRQAKLIYPNHPSPPWLTDDAAPRSVEPIVKRHSQQGSIKVLPSSRAVKVADPTARYHCRVKVIGINATGVEKAILPVRVVGYAAAVGASEIKAHTFIPGIAHQTTTGRLDSNGGRPKVGPQGSISAADGAIAESEGARKAADMNSNSAAVARGTWEGGVHHGA